jgi:hypothetical protein
VTNSGTDAIGIFLSNSNGTFANQTTFSTGYDSTPYSLAVGDFNNDNHLDIAVANYGTNNIGILLGYGNGSFENQRTYTTLPKSNPSSIVVGDFNNDHQLDIVVTNNGTGNIGIFLGHGNGTFLDQTTYSIGSDSHPQYITIGHFNKDNELYIVTVDSQNDGVHILRGYGNGTFAALTTYDTTSQSSPVWITVADFNHDNQSDIVVANYGTNNVLVLIGYSTRSSARQTNYNGGLPDSITSVVASDFNNDHIPDLVFAADRVIFIQTGLSNGTFGEKAMYSTNAGSTPQYICVGDLNNDNRMDVIYALAQVLTVWVFFLGMAMELWVLRRLILFASVRVQYG